MKALYIGALIVALTGCQSVEQRQSQNYLEARAFCIDVTEAGTDARIACVNNMYAAKENSGSTQAYTGPSAGDVLERIMRGLAYGAAGVAAAQALQPPPPPRPVVCRWMGPWWTCN